MSDSQPNPTPGASNKIGIQKVNHSNGAAQTRSNDKPPQRHENRTAASFLASPLNEDDKAALGIK
jgi:hypothetical protein